MKFYVYIIKSHLHPESNGYIGKTKHVENRFKGHKKTAEKGVEKPLYQAMRKYGIENFTIKILSTHMIESSCFKNEKRMTEELNTFIPNGYNPSKGGQGASGYKRSEETKNKVGVKSKIRWESPAYKERVSESIRKTCQTLEYRAKQRAISKKASQTHEHKEKIREKEFRIRTNASIKKGHQTIEYRENASLIMKRIWESPEGRIKMSEASRRSHNTPEYRANVRASRTGEKHTQKHKDSISLGFIIRREFFIIMNKALEKI